MIRSCTPKRFSGFGARILRIGDFSGWKWKFFEISSWHFKHPIKLNFLIWHLGQPYVDKKIDFGKLVIDCRFFQVNSGFEKWSIYWSVTFCGKNDIFQKSQTIRILSLSSRKLTTKVIDRYSFLSNHKIYDIFNIHQFQATFLVQ